MKTNRLTFLLTALFFTNLLSAQIIELNEKKLDVSGVIMSIEQYKGKQCVKVIKTSEVRGADMPTHVKVKDIDFRNGTINVNVLSKKLKEAGPRARGFIGISFRINDNDSKFENIYLRPTNARAEDQLRSVRDPPPRIQPAGVPGAPFRPRRARRVRVRLRARHPDGGREAGALHGHPGGDGPRPARRTGAARRAAPQQRPPHHRPAGRPGALPGHRRARRHAQSRGRGRGHPGGRLLHVAVVVGVVAQREVVRAGLRNGAEPERRVLASRGPITIRHDAGLEAPRPRHLDPFHHHRVVEERLAALVVHPLDRTDLLGLVDDGAELLERKRPLGVRAAVEEAMVAFEIAGIC